MEDFPQPRGFPGRQTRGAGTKRIKCERRGIDAPDSFYDLQRKEAGEKKAKQRSVLQAWQPYCSYRKKESFPKPSMRAYDS